MAGYQEFLGNLNNGFSGQDFVSYASGQGVNASYNKDLSRLLVGNTPVNLQNLGMQVKNGKLYGDQTTYQQLLQPYLAKNQQIPIMNLKPYQTPEYIKQYLKDIIAEQMSPWEYNMEEDPSVIHARKQLEKSMAEMAGQRGFLYGSEQQNLTEQAFMKVAPQFEDLAYSKNADRYQRQMELANTIMQWDDMMANRKMSENQLLQVKTDFMLSLGKRDLDMFKVMLSQRRFNMEIKLEENKFSLEKRQKELDVAWKRVNDLGYADNQTAKILGIKPGTQAGKSKEMATKLKYELALMKKKNEYDIKMLYINKRAEMQIIKEQDRVQTKSQFELMEAEYGYKKEIVITQEYYRRKLEEKRIAEAEERAAAAEAKRLAAAEAKAKKFAEEARLDVMYKGVQARFKAQFVKKGYVSDGKKDSASKFLYDLYKEGDINKQVYNRMIAEYWLDEYVPQERYTPYAKEYKNLNTFQNYLMNASKMY